MKIWVTGIAGFLGSHLAEGLRAEGHEVWGNDNLSGGTLENLPKGVGFVTTDCRYQKEMQHQLELVKPEVLYHCAALAHEGLSSFSPALIFDNVAQASVSVFSAAIAAGVKRIVFLSSMARYGKGAVDTPRSGDVGPPFREDWHIAAPVDPYGIAKVAAEQVLQVLCETHGVEYRIAVPHNIIGTRQCFTDPFRNVASIFLNRLKQGKAGIIYGDGTQVRCFSPVDDIVPCLVKMGLDDSLPNGGIWNLGPDKGEMTINELYAKCCGVAGVALDALQAPGRPNEVPQAYCTADKARAELGYESRVLLDGCLREMCAAIPAGGKPFRYENRALEITAGAPVVWKERQM